MKNNIDFLIIRDQMRFLLINLKKTAKNHLSENQNLPQNSPNTSLKSNKETSLKEAIKITINLDSN